MLATMFSLDLLMLFPWMCGLTDLTLISVTLKNIILLSRYLLDNLLQQYCMTSVVYFA
jgi:hypothetical protein